MMILGFLAIHMLRPYGDKQRNARHAPASLVLVEQRICGLLVRNIELYMRYASLNVLRSEDSACTFIARLRRCWKNKCVRDNCEFHVLRGQPTEHVVFFLLVARVVGQASRSSHALLL